ncbi:MAG: hypothetical protein GWN84_17765 [Gammaproteobacteria bacterium]|nr:hypothetical protein [Gammaproteobacteria bacterium]NIR88948.1 hypothetical protein [Gammaproteobacteria bacterium]NIU05237.1 hypothetical protein [Gammaproteobacteria bacterium]NIV52852.1 hypothetical protein [Gammaproteobacteria bacterium]NIW85148.1 hypothetical protein [Gammaproteobacteria bacterium]
MRLIVACVTPASGPGVPGPTGFCTIANRVQAFHTERSYDRQGTAVGKTRIRGLDPLVAPSGPIWILFPQGSIDREQMADARQQVRVSRLPLALKIAGQLDSIGQAEQDDPIIVA